ncbi:MAG: DUF489 family protein, partial [Proteobacteria bacterium]|nr:DUF489 family protein [Pseudomonadota bacterium]
NSILVTEDVPADELFAGPAGVRIGLQDLTERFTGGGTEDDMEMARYVMSLIALAFKLKKQPRILTALSDGIDTINGKLDFYKAEHDPVVTHPNIIAHLADLYSHTISTMMPRIIVHGEPVHLNNSTVANKVRASLLAGIRAAYLWRQLGGSRWQFIFKRKTILAEVESLLKESRQTLH